MKIKVTKQKTDFVSSLLQTKLACQRILQVILTKDTVMALFRS